MDAPSEQSRRLVWVILGGIGRVAATAVQVFGATLKGASGSNAPLMPPSTDYIPPRKEYRP